jgi:hypothetical protein
MASADNCGFQMQGYFDGVFNWCDKDFALIGFGMNSMGAHYNSVSISIVNSEFKITLNSSYDAMCAYLYRLYYSETCGFCTQIQEKIKLKGYVQESACLRRCKT